jgi:hypothetical protein
VKCMVLFAAAALGLLACDRIQVRRESYPDGTRKSLATYVDGRLEGYALAWYANGRLRSAEHYADGEPDGQAKYWDAQGMLLACFDSQSGACTRTAGALEEASEGTSERGRDRLAERPSRSGAP